MVTKINSATCSCLTLSFTAPQVHNGFNAGLRQVTETEQFWKADPDSCVILKMERNGYRSQRIVLSHLEINMQCLSKHNLWVTETQQVSQVNAITLLQKSLERPSLQVSSRDHILLEYVHYLQNIPFWPLKFSHLYLATKMFSFHMPANTAVITMSKILLCMNYKY